MSKKAKCVIIIISLLVIAAAAVLIIMHNKSGKDNTNSNLDEKIVLNGLELQELYAYSGNYVEDGSDENVKNVLAVRVKNCTDKDLEYAELELNYGGELYAFSVSALPAGKTAQVLEMNRADYPEASEDVQAKAVYLAYYDKPLDLCGDVISIEGNKGSLTVKNISEEDINGSIIVCYKNISDGEYLGGIAYRVRIENGLTAGSSVTLSTNHYNPETCEIVFVSYGE